MDKTFTAFQKKINSYLDGSLTAEEVSEFEAFVLTHPELEEQIKLKQLEIQKIRAQIPVAPLSSESLESLHHEFKSSVFNLLKEEPKTWTESLRLKWEEFTSR